MVPNSGRFTDVRFVMKPYRADAQGREDMVLLRPICNFGSAEDAVEAFASGYPHAPEHDHLIVREIARDSATH